MPFRSHNNLTTAEEDSLSEGKIIKAWGAGCAWRTLIAIIIFFIMVIALFGLFVFTITLPITTDQRLFIVMGGFLFFLCLMVAGVLIWGGWRRNQYNQKLDAAFVPMGLPGKVYLWNGRQYHGVLNGRQVDVYFYRGPSLEIYIASQLHTRLGIGLKGRINQFASNRLNLPELVMGDPRLAHLGIFSLDEGWGRELLSQSPAMEAILRLTLLQPGLEFRNLLFQPEAVKFQLHHINIDTITPENLHAWVSDLTELIRIAEALPLPHVTDKATAMENKARLRRSDLTLPIVGITCGVIGLFASIFIVALFLVIFLLNGGI
jgi:hypothetical protein